MLIEPNAASTKLAKDVVNYRDVYDNKDGKHLNAKNDIHDDLNGKDKVTYAKPIADPTGKSYDAYRDLFFYPGRNRLGGKLPDGKPKDQPPAPVPPEITWPLKTTTKVKINPDGSIVHTDLAGVEIPEAHKYLHAIFTDILHDTRNLLEKINEALEAQNENPAKAADYAAAVAEFNAYVVSLGLGGTSPYAKALSYSRIFPVVTNEGFIVSLRIELKWKNPYHSSSTVTVP
ncbi:MAG TPA: hypothetical protein VFT34_03360 [Verrucomicrobiae bacterium]|nr:hypothetical protein [Verrucomicrobiae bacterium]